MQHLFKLIFCFAIISAIAGNFTVPTICTAADPLVIGVPHSEAYTYANMMKNSFEMAWRRSTKPAVSRPAVEAGVCQRPGKAKTRRAGD